MKATIKKNATMACYNETEQLYIETEASVMCLRARLLQVMDEMQFPRNEMAKNAVLQPV